jgi:hypothetical protein
MTVAILQSSFPVILISGKRAKFSNQVILTNLLSHISANRMLEFSRVQEGRSYMKYLIYGIVSLLNYKKQHVL